MIPISKKPSNAALKWVASLLGRMDRHLAAVIPGLAAALNPALPSVKVTRPFHKLPGYVKRERTSAGAQRKQRATLRRATNATVAKFPAERVRHPHDFRLAEDGKSYTLVGQNPRRVWTAGLSTPQRTYA